MKIAIVTDIHIGARGDSKVFHEVQRKFFEEVFFPYIDEHNITTVFDLGDTFDRRAAFKQKTFICFDVLHILYIKQKKGRSLISPWPLDYYYA